MNRSGGRTGSSSPWLAGLTSALATLAGVLVLVALVGLVVYRAPGPRSPGRHPTTVIFRKGAHVAEIAGELQRAHVVRSSALFMAAAQLTGAAHALKAGEYAFPSGASLAAVIRKLRIGDIVHHRITVPEGLTSRQVLDILMHADVLTGAVGVPPEGSVLPDTYEVVRGDSRAAVLKRMMDADARLLAELWDKRRPALPYANVGQAVILASIVEKETAIPSERPRIAAVYLNRLRQGMKLEADPTVIYGVDGGAPLGHPLRESELQTPNPYNTYLNPGLPPAPIDNPGRASLAAVMDPPSTAELYFVANGAGGHVFSATLSEHQKNVERWRKIEHERALLTGTPATATAPPVLAAAITPPPAH